MTFNSEEWPKGKLQTVWIWNPGKFPSFCTGVLKMYNFGQIPLAILVDWAVFRTFLDFTKMWTRWNFESMFLKIVHQKVLFDALKENPNFLSCRGILDIYGQWLLRRITLVRGHIWGIHSLTLIISCSSGIVGGLRLPHTAVWDEWIKISKSNEEN